MKKGHFLGLGLILLMLHQLHATPPAPTPPVQTKETQKPFDMKEFRPIVDQAIQALNQEKNGVLAIYWLEPLLSKTAGHVEQCEIRYWMGMARLLENKPDLAYENFTLGVKLFLDLKSPSEPDVSIFILKSFVQLAILDGNRGKPQNVCNHLDDVRLHFPQMEMADRQQIDGLRTQWKCIP